MSDIKAGDLVFVLRGHCTHAMAGMPKTVLDVRTFRLTGQCLQCGEDVRYGGLMAELQHDGFTGWAPLPWLKKIDPPAIHIADETAAERPRRERVLA